MLSTVLLLSAAVSASVGVPTGDTDLVEALQHGCLPEALGTLRFDQGGPALKAARLSEPGASIPRQLAAEQEAPKHLLELADAKGGPVWLSADDSVRQCRITTFGGPIEARRAALSRFLERSGSGWTPLARLTQTFDDQRRQTYERFAPDKSEVVLFMTTPVDSAASATAAATLVTVAYISPQQRGSE